MDGQTQDFEIYDGDLSAERLSEYLTETTIAVDTETMGLLPIRDRLCLVQICDSRDRISVVRIHRGQTEAPNLKALMEATQVTKIFHFARFDITTLKYHLRFRSRRCFAPRLPANSFGPMRQAMD